MATVVAKSQLSSSVRARHTASGSQPTRCLALVGFLTPLRASGKLDKAVDCFVKSWSSQTFGKNYGMKAEEKSMKGCFHRPQRNMAVSDR